MKNNLVFVSTASGGTAPAIAIEPSVLVRVKEFLAHDIAEFRTNPTRCVIPEFDYAQSEPIVRQSITFGYDTFFGAFLAVITGWYFVQRYFFQPSLYWANSEGLRLIALHGSPRKAYDSLCA